MDSPLSCLSANKDTRHIVVGGRSVFKIFDCQQQHFEEVSNLRSNRPNVENHHLTVNDVNWCKADERILISASNHGAVVIWDVQQNGRVVREYGMTEHQRTVNSLEFFPDTSKILLVASQDGLCRTIDIRRKEPTLTFTPVVESPAREVQFDPRNPNLFAVVFENGFCRMWDARNATKYERQWLAHNGPSVCLNWHPTENWLVTGGRDKNAIVWDFTGRGPQANKMPSKYCVETVASVGRVRWRPNHKYQILATPMLTETYISVWDVRRPYIPEGFFTEHKETIGGVLWKDENVFYTCGRDGKLCRFLHSDCYHFREELNPAALSVNIYGSILHSAHEGQPSVSNGMSGVHAQVSDSEDKLLTNQSATYEVTGVTECLSMEPFIHMAKNYKLSKESLKDLCAHNAHVAKDAGKDQISRTWSMLGVMFCFTPSSPPKEVKNPARSETKSVAFSDVQNDDKVTSLRKMSTGGSNNELSDSGGEESIIKDNPFQDTMEFSAGPDIFANCVFEEEMSDREDRLDGYHVEPDLNIPSENESVIKFTDLASTKTPFEDSDSPATESGGVSKSRSRRIEVEEVLKIEILQTIPFVDTIIPFDYTSLAVEMLMHLAEENDVQSVVCMALVLGEKVTKLLDPHLFELWVYSYLDQLNEFELFMSATDVQNTYQPTQPQPSTSVRVFCSRCHRNVKPGWTCKRCTESGDFLFHACSICHLPVKGIYIWCQGCAHGGHIDHVLSWFTDHKECPAGCGHFCEYS